MTAALAAATLAVAAGCATPTREGPAPGRAVIVFEASRAADAESARAAMESAGWEVGTAPAGVAHRTRSSLAIYGQRKNAGHGAELGEVLQPVVGEVEILPFLTDGPGGLDAVLWLATDAVAAAPR
jgi:hypothetical protein